MLQGPWPRVTADGTDLAALEAEVAAGRADAATLDEAVGRLVAEVLDAQLEAGLELLSDGQVRWPDMTAAVHRLLSEGRLDEGRPLLGAWTAAAEAVPAGATLAQAIPGPYTLGHLAIDDAVRRTREAGEEPPDTDGLLSARSDVTLAIAATLAREVAALVAAGCAMFVVEEPRVADIGSDAFERELLTEASRRLLAGAEGAHAMLAVTGGSAHGAGAQAIFGAPWQSVLVDLIAGPDNWYLVRQAPGDRGVVCAALRVEEDGFVPDQAPELVWAAQYAASANDRGMARVGLANATRLADRTPEAARAALRQLARGARFAVMPMADAVDAGLDPRTIRDPRPIPASRADGPDPGNRAARRRKAREGRQADR